MTAISPAHRAVLDKLAPILGGTYYLVGGVAVAAHFGHRSSRDLDLFSERDPIELRPAIDCLSGVVVDASAAGTLHLRVDGVPVTLISYAHPLLEPAAPVEHLPVPVAAVVDLACLKLSAIANRGAARDFWDLHEIVTTTHDPLAFYLGAYRRKYPVEDIGHVVRALVYFGDADASPLPAGLDAAHWDAIRRDFEAWTRELAVGT